MSRLGTSIVIVLHSYVTLAVEWQELGMFLQVMNRELDFFLVGLLL